jgi:hypothetical protein
MDDDGLVLDLYRPDGRLTVEYRERGGRVADRPLRDLLIELTEAETGLAQLSGSERADLAARIASELRRLADAVTLAAQAASE